MKLLVELENGERIEVEYVEFGPSIPYPRLEENEIAIKPFNSIYYTGKLRFKSEEDKRKFIESGYYIVIPVKNIKTIVEVEV